MNRFLTLASLLVLFVSCSEKKPKSLLNAANSDLAIGTAKASQLKTHSSDTFRLSLDSGAFVYGFVDQLTVDVKVDIYSPDRKKVGSFDNPSEGPEYYSFKTTKPGISTAVVTPFEESEGNYSMIVTRADKIATDPDARIAQIIASMGASNSVMPGYSVAVQKDGKILYSKGFGYANLENDIKITPSTVFHIASVSKQFTAFAIAILADQGKISLEDDIRKYLPELNDFGTTITINHLVHHTSGLRDQWSLLRMAGWRMDDVITRNQIMRLISRQKELNFKPGDEYVYCNTGFTLMAEIVSRVGGEPFPEWMKKNIFVPLEMKSTLFYDDHEKIVNNRAYSYYQDANIIWKKSVLNYANVGATSLFTTVEDLSLWAANFDKIKVGNDHVMRTMNQRFILNNGDTIPYAFGQVLGNYKGLPTAGHGGADAGYRTSIVRFPEQHFSVSVFSNDASSSPGLLAYELADIFLIKDFKTEKEKDTPGVSNPSPKEKFDGAGVKLTEFKGTYYSPELETRYTLVVLSDTLTAQHQRHDDIKLVPTATNTFSGNIFGQVEFTRNQKTNEVVGFKASNGRVRNLGFVKE
ncbi:hypothetical protein BH10BAC4_BH10BAC4_17250 [soil metagenome]